MGCGCKQKVAQEKIVPAGITPIQVQAITGVENPGYTREDIIRIKDYISSTNKRDSEKQFISTILSQYFGDVIPDYCDTICTKHITSRIEMMEQKVSEYENFILKK